MWFENTLRVNKCAKVWRVAAVALVIGALTGSLATRTFRTTINHNRTFQSGSAQAMRQHLDRDAARFIAPVVHHAVLDAPTFYAHAAPAGPPVRGWLLEENIHNRPPPSC
jgi:hypothetical protein